MKKLAAILLILILTALCAPAFATDTSGLGDTVARSAELAAFLDGEGRIYVSGLNRPVNATPAAGLVSIDPYRILFFAQQSATSGGAPQGRLIALTLDGFGETVITDDAYAACLDGEDVYYISRADRTQLVRYNLDSKTGIAVLDANEALDRVYASSIGIVASQINASGAYITDPISGQFVAYAGDAARQIEQGDGFEVYLTDSANLFVRMDGALNPALVDTGVRDWAIIGHNIYYLCGSDGALGLKHYSVDANLWSFVLTLPADMEPQLTASENSLFTLSSNNVIYSVDVAGQRLVNYASLPTPQSYAMSGTRSVSGYRIEAVSGQLNVYGVVADSSAQPTFTFVDFGGASNQSASSNVMLLSAYTIDAESTVWDLLQPAAQYSTLRRGSRGDAVSAIQQPLYDLGYYNYYIDGIFGWRTERAVELLQDALDLPVTGVADESLQRRILAGGLPAYDPYRALRYNDRGLRVTEMQQRLRDLGYLADDADGVFGDRTLAAVELFQREHGLNVDGIAGPDTLRLLYSTNARPCSSYIDLRRGDSGYRVRELNRRLKELYYLEGGVGSTYTAATEAAVRRFQAEIGMRQTGEATVAVQRELFSSGAPEYGDYITLRRGDDNYRVLEMQRRLRDLGYYHNALDGYFGSGTYQAVRDFQRRAGLKVTGVADPYTLRLLYSADAPAYQEPETLSDPVIELYPEFETDENGVYLIPVETGEVGIYWTADGGVDSYDVYIGDSEGNTFVDYTRTQEEFLLFSSSDYLRQDVIYTVAVTAHPSDTAYNSDTSASLRFRIVPKPVTLEDVTITVESVYEVDETDGAYKIKQDELKFRWSAVGGEVSRYEFSLIGDDGSTPSNGVGESLDATEFGLSTDVTYTLTVKAYPVGNDAGVVERSITFRVVPPESLATPAPSENEGDGPAETDAPTAADQSGSETTDPNAVDPNAAESEGDGAQEGIVDPDITDPGQPEATETAQPEVTETAQPEVTETAQPEVTETAQPEATETAQPEISVPGALPGVEEPMGAGSNGLPEVSVPIEGPSFEEPVAAPGTPNLLIEPSSGAVQMDIANPDGSVTSESVTTIEGGPIHLSWAAEGDVTGYSVRITDASGAEMVSADLANSDAQLGDGNLIPGEVYRLSVTAYFSSGDTTGASMYFMLPGEAGQAQPEAQPQPEVQAANVEEPSYGEEVYDGETYVEEPYPVEEAYDEEVYDESAYDENTYDEGVYDEATYDEGTYDEEVYDEEVYEGDVYDEPDEESSGSSDDWYSGVGADSDPSAIAKIQQRLSDWGWLGGYSSGTLDGATLQAVVDFQIYCNENGMSIGVTDPGAPWIGSDTLSLLFNDSGYAITRP